MTGTINCEARTKVVWTLSPKAFEADLAALAKQIVDFGVAAVLTVFVPEREQQYQSFRRELDAVAKKTKKQDVALLFSLVGRRAFVFTSQELATTTVGAAFEVRVVCSREACLTRQDPGGGGDVRVAVTTSDMIAPLAEGVRLAFGYGETVVEIRKVVSRTPNEVVAKVEVVVPGALRNDLDATSEVFPHGIFPMTAEDEALLKGPIYDCADAVIAHGASRGADLRHMRECLGSRTESRAGVDERVPPLFFCRIDSPKAMRAMHESFDILDGVFLNRSEFGVGVELHDLPFFQKRIVSSCNAQGKTVIVASDLLSSMRKNATPTRAEVTDIANLMLDGVDAVAIGREVTEGPHAGEAARYCHDTLASSESTLARDWPEVNIDVETDLDALARCAFHSAQRVKARALVCLTRRGYTAARLSSLRPPIDVVAITYNERAKRQMGLMSGVRTLLLNKGIAIDDLFEASRDRLQDDFGFQKGDKVVFVSLSASQVARRGSNLVLIEEFR